jgi:hypothetical protein
MPETPEETAPILENPEPPADLPARFISDFGDFEKGLDSFLELPIDDAKKAILENQGNLEPLRHSLADVRNDVRRLLGLFKSYRSLRKLPEPAHKGLKTPQDGAEILAEIRTTLSSCRNTFREMITGKNPAQSTFHLCKPTVLAHRLKRADDMIDDLLYVFEKIGALKSLAHSPIFELPEPLQDNQEPELELSDEESDREPETQTEEMKTLAEELAEQFLLITSRFGLPKPFKIAKGYGQYYPGLIGENLYPLNKGYLDEGMTKGLERLFTLSLNDELVMVRRGKRFCLSIVNKNALLDPTLIPKKPLRVPWK